VQQRVAVRILPAHVWDDHRCAFALPMLGRHDPAVLLQRGGSSAAPASPASLGLDHGGWVEQPQGRLQYQLQSQHTGTSWNGLLRRARHSATRKDPSHPVARYC
jgi:hypothetical protein